MIATQKRTANVILQWVKDDFYNLNPTIINNIAKFCDDVLTKSGCPDLAKAIKRALDEKVPFEFFFFTCY